MADAGDSKEMDVQSANSENMDFNAAESLANVFNGAENDASADVNAENSNLMEVDVSSASVEQNDEAKWASADTKQTESSTQDGENGLTSSDKPLEPDNLQQLQSSEDAQQDPADLALLTFGMEPVVLNPSVSGEGQEMAPVAEEGFLGVAPHHSVDSMEGMNATPHDDQPEKECIRIKVVSQRQHKTITVDPDYNVLQLKSMVEAKFQVDIEQICLIKDKRILGDEEVLRDLHLRNGSEIMLAVRYYPQSEQPLDGSNQAFFWPSQYTRLGLVNFDLAELQEQMQWQFNENPELVREAMMNPMVQDLMGDPNRVKEMMLSCPGGQKLLEKRPDIAEALSDPKIMEESLRTAQDQCLLEETLSKMDAMKDPNRIPTITTLGSQEIPSSETMMKMMCQDPDMLVKMFSSPYYKAMVEGMIANPAWTEKMLTNNPLLAANPHMRNQIKSFLPMFLNQLQNPEYIDMVSNPKALRAMMKVQQGICNLQNEASNLTSSMGFPNFSAPGTFNIQVEGDTEQEEVVRPSRGEVDPMSIMMTQVVRQTKEGTIGLPIEERYAKDLELMEQMGFTDRQTNIALLTATFGDVNAAASQLLL